MTYFFGPSQHDRQTAEARRIKGKRKDRSTHTHARTHASLPSRSKENTCWAQQFICFCLTSHDAFSLHLQRAFTFTYGVRMFESAFHRPLHAVHVGVTNTVNVQGQSGCICHNHLFTSHNTSERKEKETQIHELRILKTRDFSSLTPVRVFAFASVSFDFHLVFLRSRFLCFVLILALNAPRAWGQQFFHFPRDLWGEEMCALEPRQKYSLRTANFDAVSALLFKSNAIQECLNFT